MEYVYAKDGDKRSVVIALEFLAVCSILNGDLGVNPFDIQMTNTIIDKAGL
jgi:trehalose-6-phosphate synthase